ncbi:uncharacterized protein LOC110269359 [Arachis ipaensis]|uniref:uncharacterized protein LOC110269359 n=1 Tax=Arachis ipaensis TaxID=130454 RepID=UPI000A2B0532|nr:uncharacterized protein LOC110269359 [Arachis ipaensis]
MIQESYNGGRATQGHSTSGYGSGYGRGQYGRGNYSQGRNYSQFSQSNKPQCQICDKIGHTAKTCWYRYSEEQYDAGYNEEGYNNQITQPKANYSNVLATPATIQDPNWYLDSGATHHMTHDEQNLMEKEEYGGNEQVVIGNGTGKQESYSSREC